MNHTEKTVDIVVLGAGPGGLGAAIQAARNGAHVLLVDKNGYLGGNAVIGLPLLGFLDLKGRRIVGGIAQEYVNRLVRQGACLGHRPCPKHKSVTNIDPTAFKLLAAEMCREAGVKVLLHLETVKVNRAEDQIESIEFYGKGNRIRVRAELYIDCTGDGDAAYLAGCRFESG